jgi:hypothetical protein
MFSQKQGHTYPQDLFLFYPVIKHPTIISGLESRNGAQARNIREGFWKVGTLEDWWLRLATIQEGGLFLCDRGSSSPDVNIVRLTS